MLNLGTGRIHSVIYRKSVDLFVPIFNFGINHQGHELRGDIRLLPCMNKLSIEHNNGLFIIIFILGGVDYMHGFS